MTLELRIQIYLSITALVISEPLKWKQYYGQNYIFSQKLYEKLKSDLELRPKFILFWDGLPYWLEAYYISLRASCPHTNCYYTDTTFMLNPTLFDAIVFIAEESNNSNNTPRERLPHQKYIFFTIEPSKYHPKTLPTFNNFFNWTWTYKFSSTTQWPYFYIFDKKGNKVGPKKHMKWIKNMDPINETLAANLSSKRKAAVWVVSNCITIGKREDYVQDLKKSLKSLGLELDIYGKCTKPKIFCESLLRGDCSSKIQREYYFYLSFENSISEDYVTEKVINALINNAVPIVYGGADYSRFLPRGSYLNAMKYTPPKLARKMKKIMNNRTRYNDFFRWRNHYKYTFWEDIPEIRCRFCTALNDETRINKTTTIHNFTTWWNK